MLPHDAPDEAWTRALRATRRSTSTPIAFGGPVAGGVLTLEHFSGTTTRHLHGLAVELGSGVGGRAATADRMVAVADYKSARSISHEYDDQVLSEGIASTAAVPVIVAGEARGVLYAAVRERARFGHRMETLLFEVAERLAHELAQREEIERRASFLAAQQLAGDEGRSALERMREAQAELRTLMASVDDPDVMERLEAISGLLHRSPQNAAVHLSPREVDVLSLVGLGCSYAEVGRRLGLSPQTVKTYMRDVIGRLGVRGRHEAVVAARRLGILL